MSDTPDYVEILGASVRAGKPGCGISLREHGGAIFQDIGAAQLRSKVNEAIQVAVGHFTECAARAGVEFTPSQILELSYRVVLTVLHRRDRERLESGQPRSLSLGSADLCSALAKNVCWIYCETKFPTDYARHVAALGGMSVDEFRQYENDRRPLMQDMGLLR